MANPVPKNPEERRNRIKPTRGEWVDITVRKLDDNPNVAPIRLRRPLVPWSRQARDKWEIWRLDPVSEFWSQGDIDYALETLALYEAIDFRLDYRTAPEIRRRLDALGLTPKGKRDLRYRIAFTPYKEATKNPPADENVVNLDARRQSLLHSA